MEIKGHSLPCTLFRIKEFVCRPMDKRQDDPITGPQVGVQFTTTPQGIHQGLKVSMVTEQLSFPDAVAQVPAVTRPLTEPALPGVTRSLKFYAYPAKRIYHAKFAEGTFTASSQR